MLSADVGVFLHGACGLKSFQSLHYPAGKAVDPGLTGWQALFLK